MKRILITGKDSYIGTAVEKWLLKPEHGGEYVVDSVDMRGEGWEKKDFSRYDVVFHVAGIAHADIDKVSEQQKVLYFKVNCDLAEATALKAKKSGVRQFIFMSSIIIYGEQSSINKKRIISASTKPSPSGFYGESKWKAELKLKEIVSDNFKVAILRAPMIYGNGCKGNFKTLETLASILPVFPDYPNERSMLHIDNLSRCIKRLVDTGDGGVFFPQDPHYIKTAEMVEKLAAKHDKRIRITKSLNWIVKIASVIPGRIGKMTNKAFGSLVYEKDNRIEEEHENRKVLLFASVASMISQFNVSNIELLQSLGYEVHVACNFNKGNTCDDESIRRIKAYLAVKNVCFFQIDTSRNILDIISNFKAYKQLLHLCKYNNYLFVHCQSPIGGVLGRLAGYATNTKVIYTAHGFHFYKGAPLLNWIIFYPLEKYLSRFTHCLITINKEDYQLATKKFKATQVYYMPGVGIDLNKFYANKKAIDAIQFRKALGIGENDIIILSIGELNKNKNHETIIKAMGLLYKKGRLGNCYYLICGIGHQKRALVELAHKQNISNRVILLDYRTDIPDIINASDIFAFPSHREGLGLAAIEAMACELPLLTSNIQGINDYSINGRSGFKYAPDDVIGFSNGISKLIENDKLRIEMGIWNGLNVEQFSIDKIMMSMKEIYMCYKMD